MVEDHLSRLIVSLVRESLDLSEIAGRYTSGLGQPRAYRRSQPAKVGVESSNPFARSKVPQENQYHRNEPL